MKDRDKKQTEEMHQVWENEYFWKEEKRLWKEGRVLYIAVILLLLLFLPVLLFSSLFEIGQLLVQKYLGRK